MKDPKHKSKVENVVKAELKNDKAKSRVGRISRFGLMEMSRQRIRPSIEAVSFVTCSRCRGKGLIQSLEAFGIGFIRKLRLETLQADVSIVRGVVPGDVATYLLNNKRNELLDLEVRRGVQIIIEGDSDMIPGDSRIEIEKLMDS